MSKDLLNRISWEVVTAPIVKTASFNSAGVLVAGYNSLVFGVIVGAAGDTWSGSIHIDCVIEGSADNSTGWTALAAGKLIDKSTDGRLPTNSFCNLDNVAEDEELYMVGVELDQQYIAYRVAVTLTGSHSTGTILGILCARGGGSLPPSGNLSTPA